MDFYLALLLFSLVSVGMVVAALKAEKIRKAEADAKKPKKRYY